MTTLDISHLSPADLQVQIATLQQRRAGTRTHLDALSGNGWFADVEAAIPKSRATPSEADIEAVLSGGPLPPESAPAQQTAREERALTLAIRRLEAQRVHLEVAALQEQVGTSMARLDTLVGEAFTVSGGPRFIALGDEIEAVLTDLERLRSRHRDLRTDDGPAILPPLHGLSVVKEGAAATVRHAAAYVKEAMETLRAEGMPIPASGSRRR
jgi:hypothetical protein